ncbi:two-component system, chemotaxis family, sensor kinase CheA [Thalassobacillus cyri]|uniref:Chemotaxis protein CheA n=1 Tax=Thalassobacillus cyri TaxID=571932 RepID=A0A1H4G040_9BACI|nr:chemotaxis protein CheA [Thalassobacillus cyri]SEB02973.1 two-component system, chemotaxis family, sensor kinase CheA [Thalassobacillus cyri]
MEVNQYLDIFIEESKENLQTVNDQLLELERNPKDLTIIQEIFRSAHTLKGMAATMGFQDLADLTHKMENVLDALRNGEIIVDTLVVDVLFEAVEYLEAMIMDISDGGQGRSDVTAIASKIEAIESGKMPVGADTERVQSDSQEKPIEYYLDEFETTVLQEAEATGYHLLDITISLHEDCLLKAARVYMVFEVLERAGEVIKALPSIDELENEQFESSFSVLLVTQEKGENVQSSISKVSEIEEVVVTPFSLTGTGGDSPLPEQFEQPEDDSCHPIEKPAEANGVKDQVPDTSGKRASGNKTIRVNIDRLDILMNLFEELVIDRGRLEQLSKELEHKELQETVERMARTSGDLQDIILNMRMVPVDQVFNRFPRMVRQLAKDLGKHINLEISGADTELDRTVIDEIGDPIVHLIRNAIDHGIESPDERAGKGKPPEGTLRLHAYHSGNHVFIEISDDGAGISREKVLSKAIHHAVITQEQSAKLSDKQVYELLMASGFSTADKISDVSGRGVGLDVVKNTIESLGGTIDISSVFGEGSKFSIQLPLTLSIISALLVKLESDTFAIPLSSIIETAMITPADMKDAHNQKMIDFRGRMIPLIFIKQLFDLKGKGENDNYPVVIVRKGDKSAGIVVDSFIGQQEIVLKTLGEYLSEAFAISGATILGDGQVALVLDSDTLIK